MKTIALLGGALALLLLAGCDDSEAPLPAPTRTATAGLASTPTPSAGTPVRTITATRSLTPTPSSTPTRSLTPTPTGGPSISFFGLLRADNSLIEPAAVDTEGRPIFLRPQGSGFVVVVEAKRGTDRNFVAGETFDHDPANPALRPDLQIVTNRALGNGSAAVCDDHSPNFGGVPAIDPPDFGDSQAVADALNDFGCRFIDGSGGHRGRSSIEACILGLDGQYRFGGIGSEIQFCSLIPVPVAFPRGDTILTARVRNRVGTTSAPQQIVVRVGAH